MLDDPVNLVDPLGLDETIVCIGEMNCGGGIDWLGKKAPPPPCPTPICVTAARIYPKEVPPAPLPIVITGTRIKSSAPPQPKPKPKYCSSLTYRVAEGTQAVGENVANFASGVIAAGLIGKNPQIVGAGESVGAAGLFLQSLGSLGKFVVSGNTAIAALDAASMVTSFMKTQTQAAQIASGHTMGAAVTGAQELGRMDPCK